MNVWVSRPTIKTESETCSFITLQLPMYLDYMEQVDSFSLDIKS